MLTLFTVPKPFLGHINVIQRNAIKSWALLRPKCEIILFGDDEGTAETADEFGALHVSNIERNNLGIPLMHSVFNSAQKLAKNSFLAYINADIILMNDFTKILQFIKEPLFLVSGRRLDLSIKEEIDFNELDWGTKLRNLIIEKGSLHGFSGMDYFIFPKNLRHGLLPFAVGRPGWDCWLVYHMKSLKIPVIDATKIATIIHQNHDYSHSPWGKNKRVEGPELQKNIKLAGGFSRMLTLREADWIIDERGLRRPELSRRIFSALSLFYPWRLLLSVKRKFQEFLQ